MTKADLVEEIAAQTGISRNQTAVIVDQLLDAMSRALSEGRHLEIRGFGTFKVRERRARRARNPRSGSRGAGTREARAGVQAEQGAQGRGAGRGRRSRRARTELNDADRGMPSGKGMEDEEWGQARSASVRRSQPTSARSGFARTGTRSGSVSPAESPARRLIGRAYVTRGRWVFDPARRWRGGRRELVWRGDHEPLDGDWCIAEVPDEGPASLVEVLGADDRPEWDDRGRGLAVPAAHPVPGARRA